MGEILAVPTPTHIVYIPFVLLVGIVIGWVIGRRAGIRQGKAEFLGSGPSEDEDL